MTKTDVKGAGGEEDNNTAQSDVPDAYDAPKISIAKKCAQCVSSFFVPIQGGILVSIDSQAKMNEGQEFVKSFFYWEFILHIQKTILQILVVYMVELN